MGYQALLFCPDDKTARTVTQVLSELEFTVEACIEPFAAVKKLMGQHFDAVVVDCDNEQNATLLFKSARNSTSNQTSLAVAVVEGQAGVAKAFRIGANLVLTKPINIEQAKGTLRVARGLLRKSDPTKPGSATATGSFPIPAAPAQASAPPPPAPTATAPPAPKPVAPKPVSAVRPASSPLPPKPATTPVPKPPQVSAVPKPATPPAWPAAAATVAAKTPAATPEAPAPVAEKPAAPPALYSAAVATPTTKRPAAPSPAKPTVTSTPISSGAASAPAPAREPELPKVEHKAAPAEDLFEKSAAASTSESGTAFVGSAPSFSFGAATTDSESSGANKKIFIGIAAAVLVAVGAYFGWSHFKGSGSATQQVATTAAVTTPAPKISSAQPVAPSSASGNSAPASEPEVTLSTAPSSSPKNTESGAAPTKPHPGSSAKSNPVASTPEKSVTEKSVVEEKPEEPALVVKGGKAPVVSQKAAPAPDAPAPTMIGIAAPAAALPNLGTSEATVAPRLQTLSVSQGVSQGLLYKKVAPSYPQSALRMHIEGEVQLMATISKEGNITRVKVLNGDIQLAKAASEAVKQWKYKPYLLNGEPVEIQTQVTVNFKLPH